ncbi:transglutaminase domain-containing protein [bacterium]|nr:MAG: transglutaminase domain-containing protein [bacterium]
MGRQASSGLLPVIAVALLLMLPACREKGKNNPDPSLKFSSTEEKRTRTLGIYSDGIRVGTYNFSRQSGIWDGQDRAVELSEKISLRLSFRQDSFTVMTSQISYLDDSLSLLGSHSNVDFGAGKWEVIWNRINDDRYLKTETMGRRSIREEAKVPAGMLTTEALNLYLHNLPATGPMVLQLELFNLTLGRPIPVRITSHGADNANRLFSLSFWGMDEQIWLDGDGMVTRETLPWGVEAVFPSDSDKSGALPLEKVFAQTAVPARGIPRDIGSKRRVVLSLNGSISPPPITSWQTVTGNRKRIVVDLKRPQVPPKSVRLERKKAVGDDNFGLDLQSPRITELAENITGGIDDPWEKAQAVGRWVFTNLGKSMRECFSALDVLEAREGECQSHSILTVALCRAAGVPARFVYGVVYMSDRDAYLYHTWVETYAGEWIPMDPTLGSFPAGVDHLTLVQGGYKDQFSMFPYILVDGGWSIDYVEED